MLPQCRLLCQLLLRLRDLDDGLNLTYGRARRGLDQHCLRRLNLDYDMRRKDFARRLPVQDDSTGNGSVIDLLDHADYVVELDGYGVARR